MSAAKAIQELPAQTNIRPETEKWRAFAAEIDSLGRELRASTSKADFLQLRKMERWGRVAGFFGYATAWIFPNPISALLISLANYTRWALVFHPISHGALDNVPGIPKRYTSKYFASGFRRYLDWFDWIAPANWHAEHDYLHHYFTGTDRDPDIVGRNARYIRELKAPLVVRYFLSVVIACIWKPFYYAPNTLVEARFLQGKSRTNQIDWDTWNPLKPAGRELWFTCLLPYAAFRFAILPALFLPLGARAATFVLLNSLLAEVFANLHGFFTIAPNHTGDDVFTFSERAKGRAGFYLHQILGTINFPAAGEVGDYLYGGMNYQIEHHLWPDVSLLQCQKARPRLKEICSHYGVDYKEKALPPRVLMTIRMIAGSCSLLEVPQAPGRSS